jgi:hypothetical protein
VVDNVASCEYFAAPNTEIPSMAVQLTPQANAALAEVMRKNKGQLPAPVEARLAELEQSATQQTAPLSLQDVERILQTAMPQQQQLIKDACGVGSGYHPDGANAQFLTQILSARVEKIDEVLHHRPTVAAVPRRYDPYHAEFSLDPRAQSMLLFNAQNVDRNGNALLMKVVMRMTPKLDAVVFAAEADIEARLQKTLTTLRPLAGAITETDVRAFFGLPTDGGADANTQAWLARAAGDAAWLAANAPAMLPDKKRVGELLLELNEVKQKYIDERLPNLDLGRYRREPADAKPDVTLVGSKVTFVKTSDTHETEFNFGAPLKQVSLGANNKEISSSVFVRPENQQLNRAWADPARQRGRDVAHDNRTEGDNLDRSSVVTFDDRIRVSVRAKEGRGPPPGSWLDEVGSLTLLDVKLHIDRGVIFEPGAQATVNLLGNTIKTAVPADDAALLGNSPQSHNIDTTREYQTVRQFLNSAVTRTSWAQAQRSDQTSKPFSVASLVYANAANINVGARTLAPLGDTVFAQRDLSMNKMKLEAVPAVDPQNDGVTLTLTLGEGFLSSEKDASVKGYTIQVGFFNESNLWMEAKSRTVSGERSKAEEFRFHVADFDAMQKPKDAQGNGTKMLEVRLYNADGIPAERIQIPFREVKWGG